MKHVNERTEAIISTTNVRVDYKNDVKEGDIVPHKELVQNVKIYTPIYDQNGYTVSHQLIAISKDDILDIAKQIQEIESKRFDAPYDKGLPF